MGCSEAPSLPLQGMIMCPYLTCHMFFLIFLMANKSSKTRVCGVVCGNQEEQNNAVFQLFCCFVFHPGTADHAAHQADYFAAASHTHRTTQATNISYWTVILLHRCTHIRDQYEHHEIGQLGSSHTHVHSKLHWVSVLGLRLGLRT